MNKIKKSYSLRKVMNRPYIIVALIAVSVLFLLAAGCSEKTEDSTVSSGHVTVIDDSLAVHQFTGDHPRSTAVISGRAENSSDLSIDKVVITARFYNANGEVIATESATRDNVAPHEIWNFTIQTTSPDAWKTKRYDISVDTP
jgi:hypothetical protein